MDELGPLTLIVKAPNLRIEDKRVACDRTWTVRRLKEHLSTVYPEKPHEDQQKLVYFGKLLRDDSCLHEVLTQESFDDAHTVHLVCATQSAGNEASKPYIQRYLPASHIAQSNSELRHRPSSTSVSQQPTPDLQNHQTTPPTPPGQPEYWQSYWSQMQAYQQQQTLPVMTPQQQLWMQLHQQQMALYYEQAQQRMQVPHSPQSAHVTDPHAPPPPADQPANGGAAAAQPPPAADQDEAVQMNAQGGVDAAGGRDDWLDRIYSLVRFSMLLMLLYFYTTLGRFAIVVFVGLFFYLAQGNLFRPRRRRPAPPPVPQQQPAQNEQNQAENQNNENNERDSQVNQDSTENSENNNNIPVEEITSWTDSLKLCFTFIVTFFSSLIPQNPAAVVN